MLEVVADSFDDALDLAVQHEKFSCEDFSFFIAPDGMSGIVVLLPEWRPLIVSNTAAGYVQIRVADSDGTPLGSMTVSAQGQVTWSTPDLN